MDWKKFLKPTLAKVCVTILLIVLFDPFIVYDNGTRCIRAPCPHEGYSSIFSYSAFSVKPYVISFDPIVFCAGGVLSYLLSCAIIHFAGKRGK